MGCLDYAQHDSIRGYDIGMLIHFVVDYAQYDNSRGCVGFKGAGTALFSYVSKQARRGMGWCRY